MTYSLKPYRQGFLPRLLLAAAAFALLPLFQPVAAESAPERTELRRADLGGVPNTEVIMSELVLPAGATVPRHSHHGEEYLYVIEGGTVETLDGKTITFQPGQTLSFERDEVHGGFTATGDGNIKVVTVHIVDKGKPLYVPAE